MALGASAEDGTFVQSNKKPATAMEVVTLCVWRGWLFVGEGIDGVKPMTSF
jgi:hypothetical protein